MTSERNRVGYKQPPVATRFKPGTSGNPSGRPKQKPTLRDEIIAALGEAAGNGNSATNAQALAKSLVREAVGGNIRATTALLNFCAKVPNDTDDNADATKASAFDSGLLDDFVEREIARRAEQTTAPVSGATAQGGNDEA